MAGKTPKGRPEEVEAADRERAARYVPLITYPCCTYCRDYIKRLEKGQHHLLMRISQLQAQLDNMQSLDVINSFHRNYQGDQQ